MRHAIPLLLALPLALVAFAPLAGASHTACGAGSVYVPQPVGSSPCAGFYFVPLPDFLCTVGVGHTTAGPVTVHLLRGYGCPLGVVVTLA